MFEKYDYKHQLKIEFDEYCRSEKRTEQEKKSKIKELVKKYEPIRKEIYEEHHQNFADRVLDFLHRKDQTIGRLNLKNEIKTHDLNFSAGIRLITALILLLITSLIIIIAFITHILWITFVAFPIDGVIIWFELERYSRLEQNLTETIKGWLIIAQNQLSRTLKTNRFQNGNYKFGKLSKEISLWYKVEIVDRLPNQYELEDPVIKPIVGGSFPSLGGIYAWEYFGEIVYIGKANNFKRRMNEHYVGLTSDFHSEKKYNSGINVNDLNIWLLAFTQDEDEQSVLETIFFDKYKESPLLNSTGTLSMQKILKRDNYKEALFNVSKNKKT